MLDEYKKINEKLALEKGVPYIDLRKELVTILRKHKRKEYKGFMTVDGEHFNEKGTIHLAGALVRAIKKWLSTNPVLKEVTPKLPPKEKVKKEVDNNIYLQEWMLILFIVPEFLYFLCCLIHQGIHYCCYKEN